MEIKKIFFIIVFITLLAHTFGKGQIWAQNVGINTTGATPAATNFLEVLETSTTASSVGIYSLHSGAITGTGYAGYFSKTGASTTNVAGYFSATGATNNYSGIFQNGYVGIGTTAPTNPLNVVGSTAYVVNCSRSVATDQGTIGNAAAIYGVNNAAGSINWDEDVVGIVGLGTVGGATSGNSANTSNVVGVYGKATVSGAVGAGTNIVGVWGVATGTGSWAGYFDGQLYVKNNLGLGTTSPTSILHIVASGAKTANYSGTLLTNIATSSTASINKYGFEITSTGTWNGTSANNVGLYVSSVTGGTNNFDAIFNGGGNVGIGITSPTQQLEITKNFKLPLSTSTTGIIYMGSDRFIHINNGGAGTDYNTFVGIEAGTLGATNQRNVGIGRSALRSITGGEGNTAVGAQTLTVLTTAGYNTACGYKGLYLSTSGQYNNAFGYDALGNNTTGSNNSGIGSKAIRYNQTGSNNTAVGFEAGMGVSANSFSNNSLFGYWAARSLTTGSNNVIIGYQAGDNLTTGANNIVIGYDIDAPSASGNNAMTIGNLIFATGVNGTGTTLSTGLVGIGTIAPSSKLNVEGVGSANEIFRLSNDKDATKDSVMVLTSAGKVGIGTTGPTVLLDVNSDIIRVRIAKTPATSSDVGNVGDICWDANYIYICVAANTWKRVAIGTW